MVACRKEKELVRSLQKLSLSARGCHNLIGQKEAQIVHKEDLPRTSVCLLISSLDIKSVRCAPPLCPQPRPAPDGS